MRAVNVLIQFAFAVVLVASLSSCQSGNVTPLDPQDNSGVRTPSIKWKFYTTGYGWDVSGTAIGSDEVVYATVGRRVYAYNPDGTYKWIADDYSTRYEPALGPDGSVYAALHHGLVCIDQDGQTKWSKECENVSLAAPVVGPDGNIAIIGQGITVFDPTGNILWEATFEDMVEFAPAYGTDQFVVASKSGTVFAYDHRGLQLWTYELGKRPSASPVIGPEGTVYISTIDKKLHSINRFGLKNWTYETAQPSLCEVVVGPDGQLLYATMDGRIDSLTTDGDLTWSCVTGTYIYCTPVLGPDGVLIVGTLYGDILALDMDGEINWSTESDAHIDQDLEVSPSGDIYTCRKGSYFAYDNPIFLKIAPATGDITPFPTGNLNNSTPVIGPDNNIVFSSCDGYLYKLSPEGTLLWKYEHGNDDYIQPAVCPDGYILLSDHSGNVIELTPDGNELWTTNLDSYYSTPFVNQQGMIYVKTPDVIYSLSTSGEKLWEYEVTSFRLADPVFTSDGKILLGIYPYLNDNTGLLALDDDGTVLWQVDTEYPVYTSPTIASDGTILIADAANLYALTTDGTVIWKYQSELPVLGSPSIMTDGNICLPTKTSLEVVSPQGDLVRSIVCTLYPSTSDVNNTRVLMDRAGNLIIRTYEYSTCSFSPDGEVLWGNGPRYVLGSSNPAVGPDGTVYVGSEDGFFYALDPTP